MKQKNISIKNIINNIAHPNKSVVGMDFGNLGEDNDTVFNILVELKKQAYQVFGITATPLDCIFSESELTSVNQVRLSPPSDYRGFCDIQVKPLEIDRNTAALNRIATRSTGTHNLQPKFDEEKQEWKEAANDKR